MTTAIDSLTPMSKATTFTGCAKEIERAVTPARFAELVAALPARTAALVAHPPLPVVWVPSEDVALLIDHAARVLFAGDSAPFFLFGRRNVSASLSTLYRVFLKLASPHYVLERTAQIYAQYARNNGTLTIARQDRTSAEIAWRGTGFGSPAIWAYRRGGIAGALEVAGARNVVLEPTSGGDHENFYLVRARWIE